MANKTLDELEKTYLSSSSVKEFDALVAKAGRARNIRRFVLFGSVAAILVLALLLLRPSAPTVNTLQIVEGIERITKLEYPDVLYIEARPEGNKVYLTAHLRDGATNTYLLYLDKDGTVQMVAHNSK